MNEVVSSRIERGLHTGLIQIDKAALRKVTATSTESGLHTFGNGQLTALPESHQNGRC
jgi:hypothetical protein